MLLLGVQASYFGDTLDAFSAENLSKVGGLMKGLVKILTGFQLEGQSLHSIPKKAATE